MTFEFYNAFVSNLIDIVPKETSNKIDEDDLMGIQSEAEQCGNDSRMRPVNEFLVRFKEIFEIFDNNGLTRETYEAVLEDMLNRLKDYWLPFRVTGRPINKDPSLPVSWDSHLFFSDPYLR